MPPYDVLIVGARIAGSATALRLARAGHRVLVLDRDRPGTDTLSTHALMRAGVVELQQLDLLDRIVTADTPPVGRVVFRYGETALPIDVHAPLYAPRRTVIDPVLASAAADAGAEFRYRVSVDAVRRDQTGRVTGVVGRDERGRKTEIRARVTVGADGMRSRIAEAVQATTIWQGRHGSAFVYGYVDDMQADGYEWCYTPGSAAGLIPTNGGQICVWVGLPTAEFMTMRSDLPGALRSVLARTNRDAAERVAAGSVVGPVRGFAGAPGWLRRAWGPGWALVGDAGYFKDPLTAHGMTDALRDAHLLAHALDEILRGEADEAAALKEYERCRDELSHPMLRAADELAAYRWDTARAQDLHLQMSQAMKAETKAVLALDRRDGQAA